MIILTSPKEMNAWSQTARLQKKRIGFVPTMGCLHRGHLSLIEVARSQGKCDTVVMSVFVNPLQFAPNEDFDKYPRQWDVDKKLAEEAGVDVVFHPSSEDMYSTNAKTYVEVADLSSVMCGMTRPTHFRGVTTVVAKLMNIVSPQVTVFGQKDAQQCFIIRRMVKDLMMETEIIMAPIIRETDGLAMSSRNRYLSSDERTQAVCLSQSLEVAKKMINAGEKRSAVILEAMREYIQLNPLAKVDYITVVNPETLSEIAEVSPNSLIALAVYFGKTRLIDNIIL
ncbi:pantoate--beta-alanine ligase [bacterium]|nr:MAG: pantoate--beta-alanine ligase [bacterium]